MGGIKSERMAKGAVLYIRVSTAEQASSNNSLPLQEKKGRDAA